MWCDGMRHALINSPFILFERELSEVSIELKKGYFNDI